MFLLILKRTVIIPASKARQHRWNRRLTNAFHPLQAYISSMFNCVWQSITNSMSYMNIIEDHWNKHQIMLLPFDMFKFSRLLKVNMHTHISHITLKAGISHLISSKLIVMKLLFCQNFSVRVTELHNSIVVWKTSTKRIHSIVIYQLTGNACRNQMPSWK